MNYPEHDGFYLKSLEFYRKFQQERSKLIDKTYASHRNTLAGRIIQNQKLPFTADQMTNAERDSIFRTRFLDQNRFQRIRPYSIPTSTQTKSSSTFKCT